MNICVSIRTAGVSKHTKKTEQTKKASGPLIMPFSKFIGLLCLQLKHEPTPSHVFCICVVFGNVPQPKKTAFCKRSPTSSWVVIFHAQFKRNTQVKGVLFHFKLGWHPPHTQLGCFFPFLSHFMYGLHFYSLTYYVKNKIVLPVAIIYVVVLYRIHRYSSSFTFSVFSRGACYSTILLLHRLYDFLQ